MWSDKSTYFYESFGMQILNNHYVPVFIELNFFLYYNIFVPLIFTLYKIITYEGHSIIYLPE